MNIRNFHSSKGIIFFIFCCWAEILIFASALFTSSILFKLMMSIVKAIKGIDYYSLPLELPFRIKIFILFSVLGLTQLLFSNFVGRMAGRGVYLFLYIADACAISCFFINSIIMRTDLRDYRFLWLGVFIVMAVSSLHLLIPADIKKDTGRQA